MRYVRRRRTPAIAIEWFDQIVASSGGDFATLAAAEAAAATPHVTVVKSGTYAGATLAKAGTWVFMPGTVINTTALTVTGNKVSIIFMPGCDVQVLYQHTGTDAYTEMRNGVASVGLIYDGLRPFLSGGGWGSIMNGGTTRHGIFLDNSPAATDGIVKDVAAQTTGGGASSTYAVLADAIRSNISGVKIIHSDLDGIAQTTGAAAVDPLVLGGYILNSDVAGIALDAARGRTIGNNVAAVTGTNAVQPEDDTDNSVLVGNIVDKPVVLDAGADNSVVVGNRVDTTLTDNSAGSTLAANDLAAI